MLHIAKEKLMKLHLRDFLRTSLMKYTLHVSSSILSNINFLNKFCVYSCYLRIIKAVLYSLLSVRDAVVFEHQNYPTVTSQKFTNSEIQNIIDTETNKHPLLSFFPLTLKPVKISTETSENFHLQALRNFSWKI
jgi:hypothetical protein